MQVDCFYKNNTDTNTFDVWIKESGLALRDANCYCDALNRFEGAHALAISSMAPTKKRFHAAHSESPIHPHTPTPTRNRLCAGDYCLPGTSNGGRGREQYNNKMTCPALHTALTNDGAVPVTPQQALSDTDPQEGHYIAAMARPDDSCVPGHCSDADCHFLRKDKGGSWSFKFPTLPATNLDLAGKPIRDIEAAMLPGHYVLCGYYWVEPQQVCARGGRLRAGLALEAPECVAHSVATWLVWSVPYAMHNTRLVSFLDTLLMLLACAPLVPPATTTDAPWL